MVWDSSVAAGGWSAASPSLSVYGRGSAVAERSRLEMTFSPGPTGYWSQAKYTVRNASQYAITLGRSLYLEGRRSGDTWHNWTHGERQDSTFLQPESEAEIIAAISDNRQIRVVGSGHSFNTGVRSDALMSLDRYTGVVDDFDHSAHIEPEDGVTHVRVRAGMRVRDINRELLDRGLAIVALPSHDAQSIAGVLSTDVHGTGREVGFVSASVVGLRIIDGLGIAHDVWSGDPLFRAALGGIGAVGIIAEVSIRCVEAFNIHQSTVRMELAEAKRQWQELLAAHDHVSFYVFPFADYVQLHRWDRTERARSKLGALRECWSISTAAMAAAVVGDAAAKTRLLPKLGNWSLRAQANADLVLPSANAFNRTIYHMHQELELSVPAAQTWAVMDRLLEIYESMFEQRRLPFTLFEVRFTPANGTEGLISAGAGDEPRTWVTIACNQAGAIPEFFAAVEELMRELDAPPHLGKWCESLTHLDLARIHGERFAQFLRLREDHDPEGRFSNEFTDRMFGPVGAVTE